MDIFCDESGGMDKDKHSFLVSAVGISRHDATRVMKKFRKAVKSKTEPKGSLLKPKERGIFFDILNSEVDISAVAISCSTTNAIGKWVAAEFAERDVFAEMLAETCIHMPGEVAGAVNIVSDSGRYPKNTHPGLVAKVEKILLDNRGWNASISFQDSGTHDGIQIADIVGNTIYQLLRDGDPDLSRNELCCTLANADRLVLKTTTLNNKIPDWLK